MTTARETTLNGYSILSIEAATPANLALELRCGRRGEVFATLGVGNQVHIYLNTVPLPQVMVGRINDQLSCLYIGHAAIDVLPEAAAAIDAWLGKQIKAAAAALVAS